MKQQQIALFASGNGTNALRLIDYFDGNDQISVCLLVCNKKDAPVCEKADKKGIEVLLMDNETIENGLTLLQELDYRAIHWIVLAGFLRKIPMNVIRGFHNRILNLHPSLLPQFGGKGMYGMRVHEAVIAAGETTTGMTVHLVNEEFDKGEIIAQRELAIEPNDTPETVARKVQELEHTHFAYIVEKFILKNTI